MYQQNWTGIYGWALLKILNIILHICHSTGADGGHLVQVHWAIWLVISWIRFTGYCRSIILIQLNAV